MSNSNPATRSLFRSAVLAVLCFGAAAGVAAAQSEERPSTQLFGRMPSHGDQQLDITVSGRGAYDDNVIAALDNGIVDPRTQTSGAYDGFTTQTKYTKRTRHLVFAASELSVGRYYPSLSDITSIQHVGSVGLSGTYGKTLFSLNQTAGYAPYFSFAPTASLFGPQPGEIPSSVAGSVVSRMNARTLGSSADLSRQFGRRTTLKITSSLQDTVFQQDGTGLRTEALGAHIVRNLSSDFGIVLGYGIQRGLYRLAPSATRVNTFHDLDLGIDFNRPLSRTRRVRLSVTTGSTLIRASTGATEYFVVGDAKLTREIGRTWNASAAYHRGVDMLDGLSEPMLQDSAIATIGGALSPRLELAITGGFSKGQLGISDGPVNHNRSYNGSARLRIGLSRTVAFSTEYSFYDYRFDRTTYLPLGLTPEFRRQGLSFGVDLWLPLIH